MLHVNAFVFDGKKTAGKVLDTLEEETPTKVKRWIDDVAVVSRSKNGFVRVNSTWAESDDAVAAGAGFGAITGGLIGATMGPGGALAGALAGGSLAGLTGLGVSVAVEDPRLEELGARLGDNTSALVLVANDDLGSDFRSAIEPYEATLIETDINDHDVKALREQLKANRERA